MNSSCTVQFIYNNGDFAPETVRCLQADLQDMGLAVCTASAMQPHARAIVLCSLGKNNGRMDRWRVLSQSMPSDHFNIFTTPFEVATPEDEIYCIASIRGVFKQPAGYAIVATENSRLHLHDWQKTKIRAWANYETRFAVSAEDLSATTQTNLIQPRHSASPETHALETRFRALSDVDLIRRAVQPSMYIRVMIGVLVLTNLSLIVVQWLQFSRCFTASTCDTK